jgi:vacuolar-type H+-ATPase subunit E/Vma4
VPFEELLDLLVEVKKEQAQALLESRKEALSSWRKIVEENAEYCNVNREYRELSSPTQR